MIAIRCNGQKREIAEGTSLAGLVDGLGVKGRKFAVERNREVVSREKLDEVILQEGDEVNVVTLVGGG
jgi:thiamine biosynthesis protein ThiS